MLPTRRDLLITGIVVLAAPRSALAADAAHSREVIHLVYDTGLYSTELDRALREAGGRGVFGGQGSTSASRLVEQGRTRAAMLGERDIVMRAASENVAERASDAELVALLRVANGEAPLSQALVDSAVVTVKASFNDALWQQMSRLARGGSEFRCPKGAAGCH